MKKNDRLVLPKNKPVIIDRNGNSLEYLKTEEETLFLVYNDCRIGVPLERARKEMQIKKYLFQVVELSPDVAILNSLGIKRKPAYKGNPYKG